MNIHFIKPKDVVQDNIQAGLARTTRPVYKMLLLGIMAGMSVGLGASGCSVVMHSVTNVGIARLLGSLVFPIGLMIIIIVGGEMFTGNSMMIMGVLDRKYKVTQMVKVLLTVYLSNFIGAFVMAYLVSASGQLQYSDGLLGAYMIRVAISKSQIPFYNAFISGILCNVLVCAAVLMAAAANDIAGKIVACFFPIMVFVICGFVHCVANMFFLPIGMLAANNENFAQKAIEVYGYSQADIDGFGIGSMLQNLVPVTIGNIVGGMLLIGVPLYLIHTHNSQN